MNWPCSVARMFSGLRSRWTTCRSWAKSSAWASGPDDQPGLVQRQLAPAGQDVAEGHPGDELEDGEGAAVVEPVIVDGGDGRVGQVGAEPGLLGERLALAWVDGPAPLGEDGLDGHGPVEPDVPAEVDDPHPAAAQLPAQLVAPLEQPAGGERRPDPGAGRGRDIGAGGPLAPRDDERHCQVGGVRSRFGRRGGVGVDREPGGDRDVGPPVGGIGTESRLRAVRSRRAGLVHREGLARGRFRHGVRSLSGSATGPERSVVRAHLNPTRSASKRRTEIGRARIEPGRSPCPPGSSVSYPEGLEHRASSNG